MSGDFQSWHLHDFKRIPPEISSEEENYLESKDVFSHNYDLVTAAYTTPTNTELT